MNKDQFSEVETLKRRLKDLNRELFHTRNLAENLREENKQLKDRIHDAELQIAVHWGADEDVDSVLKDVEQALKGGGT